MLQRLVQTLLLLFCSLFQDFALAQGKLTVGWIEKVTLSPSGLVLQAKIDSGADFSSLNTSDLEKFERDGKPWVRFDVTNRLGEKATIELEILREALIKKHFGKPQKRPVVRLGICVGNRFMQADVNLADRTNFETQLLIGRSFAAGNLLIDPATTFTTEPNCKETQKAGAKH